MAKRAQPVSAGPGYGAAGFLAALVLGTLAAVAWRAETGGGLSATSALLRVSLDEF